MPAVLDDPAAPAMFRVSGASPFPDPARPALPPSVVPRRVTLRDRQTVATVVPFASRHEVPPSLLRYLGEQFNKEIEKGDTYPMMNPLPLDQFSGYWFQGFAAVMLLGNMASPADVVDGAGDRDWARECLGTFYIKPNYPGRSSHVCNAGFVVTDSSRNRGVGRLMGEAYLDWAPRLGYSYSVFNLVYDTNVASCRIWDGLGFKRIGRVKGAGNLRSHPDRLVDAIIYGRELSVPDPAAAADDVDGLVSDERFDKIKFYLKHGRYPNGADRAEKSRLRSAATHYKLVDGDKLMLKAKEVISDPLRQHDIARTAHNQAHAGINKTTALIAERYHWSRIKETVSDVVRACAECKELGKAAAAAAAAAAGATATTKTTSAATGADYPASASPSVLDHHHYTPATAAPVTSSIAGLCEAVPTTAVANDPSRGVPIASILSHNLDPIASMLSPVARAPAPGPPPAALGVVAPSDVTPAIDVASVAGSALPAHLASPILLPMPSFAVDEPHHFSAPAGMGLLPSVSRIALDGPSAARGMHHGNNNPMLQDQSHGPSLLHQPQHPHAQLGPHLPLPQALSDDAAYQPIDPQIITSSGSSLSVSLPSQLQDSRPTRGSNHDDSSTVDPPPASSDVQQQQQQQQPHRLHHHHNYEFDPTSPHDFLLHAAGEYGDEEDAAGHASQAQDIDLDMLMDQPPDDDVDDNGSGRSQVGRDAEGAPESMDVEMAADALGQGLDDPAGGEQARGEEMLREKKTLGDRGRDGDAGGLLGVKSRTGLGKMDVEHLLSTQDGGQE